MSFLDSLETQDSLDSDQLPQPLIPTPPPSASAFPQSQSAESTTRDTQNIINQIQGLSVSNYASHTAREEQNDKFATLFNPSTPRASPASFSAPLPEVMESQGIFDQPTHLKPHVQRHSRANSTASEHSDFGAFVSVSVFEDPLTANTSTFDQEWEDVPAAAETASLNSAHEAATSSSHASASSRSTSRSRDHPSNASNPTLSFFDQFAQDAKERSSKTRSLVLDELLLHEDDPLYFLKDQQQTVHSDDADSSTIPDPPDSAKTVISPPAPLPPFDAKSTPIIDLHSDLDHEYFRPIPKTPQKHGHQPTPSRSSSFAVAEPRLAPPIASPEGATRTDPHFHEAATGSSSHVLSHQVTVSPPPIEEEETLNDPRGHLVRSPSRQSLSNSISSLPGRWMSTLLRGSSPPTEFQTTNQGARPALESIFNLSAPSDNEPGSDIQSGRSSSPQRQRQLVQPSFTHTSAFAPLPPSTSSTLSVTHGSSPFAPHVYIPPKGAPGFAGEGYNWDKGFSDELEAEREREQGVLAGSDRGRETNKESVRDPRKDNVKAKTIPYVTGGRGEPPEMAVTPTSTSTSSKPGWGSGFGFWNGKFKGGSGGVEPSSNSSAAHDDSHPALEPPRLTRDRDATRTWDGSSSLGDSKGVVSGLPSSGDAGLGAFIERKSGNIDLDGRRAMTTPVLTPELAGEIRPFLPALSRLPRSWNLIYSLDQHGISLNTLYNLCETHITKRPAPGEALMNRNAMLFVVKDAEGGIFGAWLAEGIRLKKSGQGYYGGGESFLWTNNDDTLKIFKCTGKNNYIALCEPKYISFGGGDGHYGLYLDDTLFDGSSAPCPTFNNDPLCSSGPRKGSTVSFECVGLEVWGMGS